ncbi:tetratricopeptide repeat protein [Pectobacterium brasiliense]|uniref:tetratricopeptide repeat protein n=1 Tax=Pectobacterium TaxID=122277 RepID=UPI001968E773|nr:tetratricopeptide repeat protein [Pectobacterium brasiliense]MBN3045386.1 tetratricopeptide repeat protein [Pectobacterium brasiliense]
MGANWGEKLFDLVLGNLPAVIKCVPLNIQRRARARVNDINPFASIGTNKDLLLALRLAWVEAALEIDKAVRSTAKKHEFSRQAKDIQAFSPVLCRRLFELRNDAFNRDAHLPHTPMDLHLQEIVVNVPTKLMGNGQDTGEEIAQAFRCIAATIAEWPEHEVPDLYGQIALQGLFINGTQRNFGDLVYLSFIEMIQNPKFYPEASQAFVVALGGIGVELGRQCLKLLEGQEEQLDRLLEVLGNTSSEYGLIVWLERLNADWKSDLQALSAKVDSVSVKLDQNAEGFEQMNGLLEQILGMVGAKGKIGDGPGQLAYDTVLALAKRLRPDELIDLDCALQELESAVCVALDLITKGHSSYYQDRFVDEVLTSVRQSIVQGQLAQGIQSIEQALDKLELREANEREVARRQRLLLLDTLVSQATLLRDPLRAADAVEKQLNIEQSERPAMSKAFGDRLAEYCKEGEELGLSFPLEVAIVLARKRLMQARGSDERIEAFLWLGKSLSLLGERASSTMLLQEAEQVYRDALGEFTYGEATPDWAKVQNGLGNVLVAQGNREAHPTRLQASVRAYQAALLVFTCERQPLEWAITQNNLGTALQSLGEREGSSERLYEAVQAYQAALTVYTNEHVPLEWARTQNNLGDVLRKLGDYKGSTELLQDAVLAYQAALLGRPRERVPLLWAITQNNLGNVFLSLFERIGSTKILQEAMLAYRNALLESTRERVPMEWATTQNNLGVALWHLGELEDNTEMFHEAVQAYHDALLERTRKRVPLDWATTTNNLANALRSLGEREGIIEFLQEAVQTYQAALLERTRDNVPLDWAMTQHNQGNVLLSLGKRKGRTEFIQEAVQAYRSALLERTRERVPAAWASTQHCLGCAFQVLGEHEGSVELLQEALQAYRSALLERSCELTPQYWLMTQINMGDVLLTLGEWENDRELLDLAAKAYQNALQVCTRENDPQCWARIQSGLGNAFFALGER